MQSPTRNGIRRYQRYANISKFSLRFGQCRSTTWKVSFGHYNINNIFVRCGFDVSVYKYKIIQEITCSISSLFEGIRANFSDF